MNNQLLDLFTQAPTFSNYIALNNGLTYAALQNEAIPQFINLSGHKYSGKTHLLQAWVNQALENNHTSLYLDASEFDPALRLELSSNIQYLAIDNIDNLNEEQQIALFDLFNQLKLTHHNHHLLTSSTIPVEQLTIRHDLKTRLLSGLNLYLKTLADTELVQALTEYTKQTGINIGEQELNYLLTHYSRNIGLMIKLINKIADSAINTNRYITIPLIKQVCINLDKT